MTNRQIKEIQDAAAAYGMIITIIRGRTDWTIIIDGETVSTGDAQWVERIAQERIDAAEAQSVKSEF